MAIANQIPESSMEEILASIRKIISEDESRPPALRPGIVPAAEPRLPSNNVSHLFEEQTASPDEDMSRAGDVSMSADITMDRAVAAEEPLSAAIADQTPDDAHDFASEEYPETPPASRRPRAFEKREPANDQSGGALISPRADAAVAAAFNHLASSILANDTRMIEQMAEEMMRPMLKDWLDDNLPPLVERLVREEIERVSRRR